MRSMLSILLVAASLAVPGILTAHPLGVLSTNHYTRIELAGDRIRLVYVLDIAEIPSIREFESMDRNHDGVADEAERQFWAGRATEDIRKNLHLFVDGKELPVAATSTAMTFVEGQGGLKTIRLTPVFEARYAEAPNSHTLSFYDTSPTEGRGWREVLARPVGGETIEQSTAGDRDVTNELRNYPPDQIENPPGVTSAELVFIPGRKTAFAKVVTAAQDAIGRTTDRFAGLISGGDLSAPAMLISLLLAALLGAGHALTPGHGKTIVAAYLVGSKGTAKDAALLGLMVTATHTFGVFLLGFVALFASKYILPADLFPWLGTVSGLLVVWIGLSLLARRIRHALHPADSPDHEHSHEHGAFTHSHGGRMHTHAVPQSAPLKNVVALGISGGLLPCPSAIVVLLGAIAVGRVGFGVLLIVAFSAGLAGVLTGIGLVMVFSRKFFERINTGGAFFRWVPVLSACAITIAGAIIAVQAAGQTAFFRSLSLLSVFSADLPSGIHGGALSVLGVGFVLGLKHALDTDHLVAVTTIVSERKGILGSSIIGALWGLGHTASLLIAGIIVIALHVTIPDRIAQALEFSVAGMLILLGANVLRKVLRGEAFHMHAHDHGGLGHVHPHNHSALHAHGHDIAVDPAQCSRSTIRASIDRGKRSILIGMVHGLAGSAALMLVVLAAIPSSSLAFAYIAVFGIGSVGGMLVMSSLIGLPFAFSARISKDLHRLVRLASGVVSLGFGMFYAWQIGIAGGLFM